MGALGVQTAGAGVHQLECRPACPSSGFDPNLPAYSWRVVGIRAILLSLSLVPPLVGGAKEMRTTIGKFRNHIFVLRTKS